MRRYVLFLSIAACYCMVFCTAVEGQVEGEHNQLSPEFEVLEEANDHGVQQDELHTRQKRTLLLKKKLIGAGLLGFGLGVAKGYKLGYHTAPEIHRVYLPPPSPPVKYVEYIEKPVFVQKIIEKPVYRGDYDSSWSQPDPLPPYGAW